MAIDSQSQNEQPVSGRPVPRRWVFGFTLVEMLVSTAIMLIVMLVLLQVIAGMTNIWHTSTGTISTFQSARAAFTTLTRTVSRATLKTYIDYVDANFNPINNASVNSTLAGSTNFNQIASFTRASELQFVCGPTDTTWGATAINAPTSNYPVDCVFFQAPLGIINGPLDGVNSASDKFLTKSLNTIGFWCSYSQLATTTTVPPWLSTALGLGTTAAQPFKYRLLEYIQPTENLDVYNKTSSTSAAAYNPSVSFIANSINGDKTTAGVTTNTSTGVIGPRSQILPVAENIILLVIRPRIQPADEIILAGPGGPLNATTAYSATTANAIISPNYIYDSRAWWGGYTPGVGKVLSTNYAKIMRNQLPPILDIAIIAVDPNSLVRFNFATNAQPVQVALPTTAQPGYAAQIVTTAKPFQNSINMEVDLNNYGVFLDRNHIRYRIFRSSVQIEGAAWANNF